MRYCIRNHARRNLGTWGALRPNYKALLTEKFIEGVRHYHQFWRGSILRLYLCELAVGPSSDLDNIEIVMDNSVSSTDCGNLSSNLHHNLPAKLVSVRPRGWTVQSREF